MKKTVAEPYRDIDFTNSKRGPVIPPEIGKTKISIRLDNRVLEYFRGIVEKAGGGNYQITKPSSTMRSWDTSNNYPC